MMMPWALLALTLGGTSQLLRAIDLKPQVEPHFFFSDTDPPYQRDLEIKSLFPEPEQIIVAVKGPIDSPAYQEKIKSLSYDFLGLPPVFAVQSLALGPKRAAEAFTSPLWQRMLIAKDGEASLLVLYSQEIPSEEIYRQIEEIAAFYTADGFEPIISGAPYVIHLIRRHLFEDLGTFSLAALIIFTLMTLLIFRSVRILLGTLTACANACIFTLFVSDRMGIGIGPLTANLSTMVFVFTLSHIAYMTFNWKHAMENRDTVPVHPVIEALRITLQPSFWSMLTTFLGFLTLIFVQAEPFRKLGVAGSIGTWIAFFSAYGIFPWFLVWRSRARTHHRLPHSRPRNRWITGYLGQKHPVVTAFVFLAVGAVCTGLLKIDADPHLLSYFKSGTALREGLNFIDRNWGSSPLKIVIRDQENGSFNTRQVREKLLALQMQLEKFPQVGNVISLPLVMDEAKSQVRFSYLISWERILKELEGPEFGEITRQLVTADRKQSLLLIRMKALDRPEPRMNLIEKIKLIIWSKGFDAEKVGGLYLLQGEMANLVLSSLLAGLGLLLCLFVGMGLLLSRSLHTTGALFLSLLIIPVWLLGIIGHLRVPLDMISAPAANLAVAMGVDAMIHLLLMVRHCHQRDLLSWEGWVEARTRLWKPILTSTTLLCTGFAIFTLSYFPPTQRFGLSVILGSLMAAVAALFVLPTLAGTKREVHILVAESPDKASKKGGGQPLEEAGKNEKN